MDTNPSPNGLTGISEEELAQATGESLAKVRAWIEGEVEPPVGVRRALETLRAYSAAKNGSKEEFDGSGGDPVISSAPANRARRNRTQPGVASAQTSLFEQLGVENAEYLRTQLITYIGNKRALLPFIETGIRHAKAKLGKERIDFLDLFAGSGVVARMARQHSRMIHCNDLELYSYVFNTCYQTNQADVDSRALSNELDRVRVTVRETFAPGFIAELYAPRDDNNIQSGERVFYTRRNATFLDTFCRVLEGTSEELRPFVLAPVLAQASMHANTSGVFKGFYKNKDGVGQFGGTGKNALTRIKRDIEVQAPVFSNFACDTHVYKSDANALVREIEPVDVAYFDPPYNQHPYGSNYFMLNLLCDYRRPQQISAVSGIPTDWNRHGTTSLSKQNRRCLMLLKT